MSVKKDDNQFPDPSIILTREWLAFKEAEMQWKTSEFTIRMATKFGFSSQPCPPPPVKLGCLPMPPPSLVPEP